MRYILFGGVIILLFLGLSSFSDQTESAVESPKIILLESIPKMGYNPHFATKPTQRFIATTNSSLEDNIDASVSILGPYKHIGEVGYMDKEGAILQLQLETMLEFDLDAVQSKQKTGLKLKGFTIGYLYRGDVTIMPSVKLLIKEPRTQTLIESRVIDVESQTVYIENEVASQSHDMPSLLTIEEVGGITDVINSAVDDILYELDDLLTEELSSESLQTFISIAQTIQNR